ncbi:hypothetical protein ACIQI8_42980 [Streptomyces sp. NPDC092369]|uniref:hypothetical protein n=1 Tax=Streptomyces sp. NPDC092369 TaxID=3366015 RepID=UPI003801AF78
MPEALVTMLVLSVAPKGAGGRRQQRDGGMDLTAQDLRSLASSEVRERAPRFRKNGRNDIRLFVLSLLFVDEFGNLKSAQPKNVW